MYLFFRVIVFIASFRRYFFARRVKYKIHITYHVLEMNKDGSVKKRNTAREVRVKVKSIVLHQRNHEITNRQRGVVGK